MEILPHLLLLHMTGEFIKISDGDDLSAMTGLRIFYLLFFICVSVVLSSLDASAGNYSKEIKHHFNLAPGQIKVVSVYSNSFNPKISTFLHGKQLSVQQGPDSQSGIEFSVIGPYNKSTDIEFRVTLDYPVSSSLQPEIEEVNDLSPEEIDVYRKLSKASELWYLHTEKGRKHAIELLQQEIKNKSLEPELINKIKFSLAYMLLENGKFALVESLLKTIAISKSQLYPIVFSQSDNLELLLLRANTKYLAHDFENSIYLQCQYLNWLSKLPSKQIRHRYMSIVVKGLLAQSIIERKRNQETKKHIKKSIFFSQYFDHCRDVINQVWAAKSWQLHDYHSGLRQPLDDAKLLLQRTLIDAAEWQEPRLKSQLLGQLWYYFNIKDDHIQAEKMARLAISTHLTSDYSEELAQYYSFLGTSLIRQGLLRQGQHFFRQALMIAKKTGKKTVESSNLFNLAYSYRVLGDFKLAHRYFLQSLEIDQDTEGNIDWQKGEHCNQNAIYSAMSVVQLGILARHENNLTDALKMHQCSEKVFSYTNEYYGLVSQLEIGKDQIQLKQYRKAKIKAQKVLEDDRLLLPQRLDSLLILLEIAITQQKDVNVSDLSKQLATGLGYKNMDFDVDKLVPIFPIRQIQMYRLLIQYYSMKNNSQKIDAFGERALRLIESVKGQLISTQAWSAAQYSVLAEYVKALYQLDEKLQNHQKIFQLLDSYYSINLDTDRLNYQTDAEKIILTDELKQLWHAKLDSERAVISSSESNRPLARQLADAANEQYLAYRNESIIPTTRLDKEKFSIAQIQKLMPATDIFVRYFIDDDLSFAYVLTKDRSFIQPLASKKLLRDRVEALEKDLHENTNIRQLVTSTPLNELIPTSLIQSKQYKRLVIVPDDNLHRVPFSLLNVGKVTGGYLPLSSQLELVRTHSAQDFYSKKKQNEKVKKGHIVLFADPDFKHSKAPAEFNADAEDFYNWLSQLPRLSYSAEEAKGIAKLFPNKTVILMKDKEATNQFLMSPLSRTSSVLHIATHGYYDPSTPEIVGVVTSASQQSNQSLSGFLGLEELLSQPFYSDLVVVSGCETMRGKYYKGSGNKSITRGLLAQGAQSVIGTLWKVADRPTAKFMTNFYRNLKLSKGDVARALMLTKKDFSERGRFRHPTYWAGFVLDSVNQNTQVFL